MNGLMDVYDFASYMADHLIKDVKKNGVPLEEMDIRYSILNGIAAFEDLEDEEGREYRIKIERADNANFPTIP